jgi:hypothetical protein
MAATLTSNLSFSRGVNFIAYLSLPACWQTYSSNQGQSTALVIPNSRVCNIPELFDKLRHQSFQPRRIPANASNDKLAIPCRHCRSHIVMIFEK